MYFYACMYVCMHVTTAHSYVTLYTYAACICDPNQENMHGEHACMNSTETVMSIFSVEFTMKSEISINNSIILSSLAA